MLFRSREGQLHKRQREFDFTQRVVDAKFLANPEDRQFEVRMTIITTTITSGKTVMRIVF